MPSPVRHAGTVVEVEVDDVGASVTTESFVTLASCAGAAVVLVVVVLGAAVVGGVVVVVDASVGGC